MNLIKHAVENLQNNNKKATQNTINVPGTQCLRAYTTLDMDLMCARASVLRYDKWTQSMSSVVMMYPSCVCWIIILTLDLTRMQSPS